ncbi:MAG: M12 family metallopeptidase [Bacteroidales bacterium]
MRKIFLYFSLLCFISCSKDNSSSITSIQEVKDFPAASSYTFDSTIVLSNGLLVGILDTMYFIEGDIELSKKQFDLLANSDISTKASVTADYFKYWDIGRVYYSFSSNFLNSSKTLQAMSYITSITGIEFIESSTRTNRVIFENSSEEGVSSSYIGCIGGVQSIKIATSVNISTIVHEICHTLGFAHEQCRADRDDYININWNNIESGREHNFSKNSIGWGHDFGEFDFNSLMLYSSYSFAVSLQQPTMVKNGTNQTFYGGSSLSTGDILGIKYIYGPPYAKIVTTVSNIVKDEVNGPAEEWEIYYNNYIYFYTDKNFSTLCTTSNPRLLNYIKHTQNMNNTYYTKSQIIIPSGVSTYNLGETRSEGFYEYGVQRYFFQETFGLSNPLI